MTSRFAFLAMLIGSGSAHAAAAAGPAGPASAGSLLQVVFGLIVVLALMAAVAWAMKRFGPARMSASSPVKIVGGVAVGSRERIMVVEVGDQWIVVGVTPGSVRGLSTMPRQAQAQPNPVEPGSPLKSFAERIKQSIEKRHVR